MTFEDVEKSKQLSFWPAVRGPFLTFEGGDGVGKTTQLLLLKERLRSEGIDPVVTYEPGGPEGSEDIRKLLLAGTRDWDPLCEAMLHCAARREHVVKLIERKLAGGWWVLCDRFHDSTVAYQCYGQRVDPRHVEMLRQLAVGELRPDLTLLLDLEAPGEGLARAAARSLKATRYEALGEDFHRRVRDGFREIARKDPERVRVVSADGTQESVREKIWDIVMERFEDKIRRPERLKRS